MNAILTYRKIAAADTNAALIVLGQTNVIGWHIYNNAASARFVKLYDTSTAPTVGTDTPKITIGIAANSSVTLNNSDGINFGSGVGIGIVTGIADNSTAAPSASDVAVTVFYN